MTVTGGSPGSHGKGVVSACSQSQELGQELNWVVGRFQGFPCQPQGVQGADPVQVSQVLSFRNVTVALLVGLECLARPRE